MNIFEHPAGRHFRFGLGHDIPGRVGLDCPTRKFTRGDALASAHLAKFLYALSRHQVLLADEIGGFCGHAKLLPLESNNQDRNDGVNPYIHSYLRNRSSVGKLPIDGIYSDCNSAFSTAKMPSSRSPSLK
jgi:hypothetical protein